MVVIFSPITSTPETQSVVRTILHGEYESVVKEVEEGTKPVQKVLVAMDLSGEAQHALEWTIGTVLGDGHTLMAIYAIDPDTVEHGGKTFPDDKIALTLWALHLGSLVPMVEGWVPRITIC
ncbi:hypothetical protein HOY82DRAFT_611933 [Tuber indicum]|nr:hypothetical protein HOY82DRAFT_611933 [Tuber indicum]